MEFDQALNLPTEALYCSALAVFEIDFHNDDQKGHTLPLLFLKAGPFIHFVYFSYPQDFVLPGIPIRLLIRLGFSIAWLLQLFDLCCSYTAPVCSPMQVALPGYPLVISCTDYEWGKV